MNLFERFEELSRIIDSMNAQAADTRDIPVILLHDYVHYCDVQSLLESLYSLTSIIPGADGQPDGIFFTVIRWSEKASLARWIFIPLPVSFSNT